MNCRYCQQPLPADAAFCPSCGGSVSTAATGATQRLIPGPTRVCPKCSGAMERGFIPDEFRDRNEVSVWVRGAPQRGSDGEIQLGGVEMWQVVTLRCAGCGYLESYADKQIGAEA